MNREYHKHPSVDLERDMELLVFGHAGSPILVFPTTTGRFFDYEDRGMIASIAGPLESGAIQVFCVDSLDIESWCNRAIHPRDRVLRHIAYEEYILNDVIPFIRERNPSTELTVTGCSLGGYHAVNLALRHPYQVTRCVSMGGAFDIRQFLDGYFDENCYFHSPQDFLPNLADEYYLSRYRDGTRIILATGEQDICLDDNLRLSRTMNDRRIPHWLDVWGNRTGHDWPWWQQMAQKFFA